MEYLDCEISGQVVYLLAEKALYWPAEQALVISDLHFGKSAHFRKHGLAVPQAADQATHLRLQSLLLQWAPRSLYCLGDLFHSTYNADWENVCQLKEQHPNTEWILVAGNHDILNENIYKEAGITCIKDSTIVQPFEFRHEPQAYHTAGTFTVCGHIHPAVKLRGKAHQKWTAPCFWLTQHQLILPAFGSFTGSHMVQPSPEDRVFSIAGRIILESF
jgi:uncharacterized protein